MDEALGHEITQLLQAWRQGDEGALEKLTPQVYRELHRAAKHCMARERDGHTLQTTALINELYLRLSDLKLIDWQNRGHFFALCARQMRRTVRRSDAGHRRGIAALQRLGKEPNRNVGFGADDEAGVPLEQMLGIQLGVETEEANLRARRSALRGVALLPLPSYSRLASW